MTAGLKNLLSFRGVLAVALMFWCAGTGCLVVGYARTMNDTDSSTPAAEQQMTGMQASMDAHACCKAKHKSAKRAKTVKRALELEFTQFGLPAPVRGNAMSCCPLTTGSIVVASRSQLHDDSPELPRKDSASLNRDQLSQPALAVPLRLPNRAQSYLLDCAFLI